MANETELVYFTTDELRARYSDLANDNKYPDDKLEASRAFAEQWFEAAAKVAYVPREATETLEGNGRRIVFVAPHIGVQGLSACSIDDVELTDAELALIRLTNYGAMLHPVRWPAGATITVTYQHGYEAPTEAVKSAVMKLALEDLMPSQIPSRATSMNTDTGAYRISQADRTGKTVSPRSTPSSVCSRRQAAVG
jgi:hypothetical protein